MRKLFNSFITITIAMACIYEMSAQQNDDNFASQEKKTSYAQRKPKRSLSYADGTWTKDADIYNASMYPDHPNVLSGEIDPSTNLPYTEHTNWSFANYSTKINTDYKQRSEYLRPNMVALFPSTANAAYEDYSSNSWATSYATGGWTLLGALINHANDDHWRTGVQAVTYTPDDPIPPYASLSIILDYKVVAKRTQVDTDEAFNYGGELVELLSYEWPYNMVTIYSKSDTPANCNSSEGTPASKSIVRFHHAKAGNKDGSSYSKTTTEYTFDLSNKEGSVPKSVTKTLLCAAFCQSKPENPNLESAAFYIKKNDDKYYQYTYYGSVTYENNDGNANHHETIPFSTKSGYNSKGSLNTYSLLTDPSWLRLGYDLYGWTETDNRATPTTKVTPVTELKIYDENSGGGTGPHTVYAIWKPMVKFLDASNNEITSATAYYFAGDTPDKPSDPTKSSTTSGDWTTNYIFDSWRNADTGDDKDKPLAAVGTKPVTYYPRFRSYSKNTKLGGLKFEGYGWTKDAICAQIDGTTKFIYLTDAKELPANLEISLTTMNPNLLIFANQSDGTKITNTRNVVLKGSSSSTCDSLVVTDRYDFYNPEAFTATKSKYVRVGSIDGANSEWGTLYLPFAFPNNDAVTYYALTDVEEERDAMIFETQPATTIAAYTPVIYKRVSGKGAGITVTNASSSTVPQTVDFTKSVSQYGGYTLIGTLNKTIYAGDDFDYPDTNYATDDTDDDVYYFKQDKFLHLEDDGRVTIPQYRCYFTHAKSAGAPPLGFSIIVAGQSGADDITSVFTDGANGKAYPIYDLMGRRVASPQKGHIYIAGGKKFILK